MIQLLPVSLGDSARLAAYLRDYLIWKTISETSAKPSFGLFMPSTMASSISSSIVACLKSFNEFIGDIRNLRDKDVRGLVASAWEDELGRLRMWAANIGAHQTGQSSLDFRLRDASHVRDQIIKLLQGLLRRLQDAREVLADDEESDDEAAVKDDATKVEDRKTEIQELQESLATNINCLFQMSILVRKPAQHDLHLGSRGADVAAFEPFDYNHVKEKYPEADDALVKRLGYAITRRRKYLKYRERHATKLRQGISNVYLGAGDDDDLQGHEAMAQGTGSVLSSTIATELEQRNINFDDKASDTNVSQTSYAPTLLSGGNVTIPPPPKASLNGKPFECPYCFYIIKIDRIHAWNKHIFQDLQPYICIAPTCTTPDKMYPTRHEWLHHSSVAHPAVMTHDGTIEGSKSVVACLLCKETFELRKQHDRHLARHLQELSLFVLPGIEQDSDHGEDGGAASSSDTESVGVARSHHRSRSPEGLPAVSIEDQPAMEGMEYLYVTRKKNEDEEGHKRPTNPWWKSKESPTHLKEFEEEVTEKHRLLGTEHTDTLNAISQLNRVYQDIEMSGSEAQLGEKELEAKKKLLGAEHPDTLESMFYLAQSYQRQKQLGIAQILYKQALKGYEKIYGPNHKSTILTANFLGDIYRDQGRFQEAEVMCRQALNGNEETMGPNHMVTLISITRLGDICQEQGKLEEAEVMYQKALDKMKMVQGPQSCALSSAANSLMDVYRQQGKLAEAERLWNLRKGYEILSNV